MSGVSDKYTVITNGYDPDDFEGLCPAEPSQFTISYIGTLSDAYPVDGFLKAIKTLNEKGLNVGLKFVGSIPPSRQELIKSALSGSKVEFLPYASHKDAITHMINSSALLLIIPDHGSSKSIITGKLFEYLASGRPIICLGPPDGDAASVIGETGHGFTFGYNDHEAIAGYAGSLAGKQFKPDKEKTAAYRRDNLAREVAALLNRM
jgi:glycosyltransferase involved in cell wall biosynthesis